MVLVALLGAAGVASGSAYWWRTHNVGPVERGFRVASANACFVCHGPSGERVDLDRGLGGAPPFTRDELRSAARDASEIREWILDGEPSRLRGAAGSGEEPAIIRMPHFRNRLTRTEVDDLVAFVRAESQFDELPPEVAAGRTLAGALGCFGCHGPGGQGDTPNAGSLKGYIPSWSGADFEELVRDPGELREWIRDGAPKRLREHPVARFFLERQTVKMPAYGARVSADEIQSLEIYIRWLRTPRSAP